MRRIGSLSVSVVGLGCNNFGWRIGKAETKNVVAAALDSGINFLDTADIYGAGQSEEFLAEAMEGRRNEIVLATKFGMSMGEGKSGASRAWVRQACDDSLRRLKTDRIDLYQLHTPDPKTPIAETLEALDGLVKAGKIREIGCSNFSVEHLRQAAAATKKGAARFVSVQNQYSLFHREPEASLLPECRKTGVAFIPYFPLANGLLTGKYRKGQPLPENSRGKDAWGPNMFSEKNIETAEALSDYASAQGHSLLELAVSWLATQPGVAIGDCRCEDGGTGEDQCKLCRLGSHSRRSRQDQRDTGVRDGLVHPLHPYRRMHFHKTLFTLLAVCATANLARSATVTGIVIDPSGRPIPGAQVAAFNPLGIINQQTTGDQGQFEIYLSPLYEGVQLRVAAPGFKTVTVAIGASVIKLSIAPQSDSVRVIGSALDIPASQQGSSVSVITSREIRERNEPLASDLLREIPGVVLAQSGPRGGVSSLFVRGADSKYNLVLLDGIPINSFNFGGLFDFAHIPSDFIEQIDVARGPQSAIYGSYALGSVVNFETRSAENGPAFDFLAEGGTHAENRFSLSGSGMVRKNWGLAGSLSSLNGNGPVPNSDYRNDNVFLALSHHWHTQSLFAFGDFDSNDAGQPGAFGSNPKGYFTGIDLVSRSRNDTSTYGLHYQNELFDKLRLDVFAGFFLNNNSYLSPYGYSFNKDIRGYAEGARHLRSERPLEHGGRIWVRP